MELFILILKILAVVAVLGIGLVLYTLKEMIRVSNKVCRNCDGDCQ